MTRPSRPAGRRAPRAARTPWPTAILLALLAFFGTAAVEQGARAQSPDGGAQASGPNLPYTVTLEGVAEEAMAETIRRIAELYTRQEEPPASRVGLRQRADDDTALIRRYLRSEGYYAARVEIRIGEDARPAPVTVAVDLGPAYTLRSVTFEPVREPMPAGLDAAAIGLELGARSTAREIVAAQDRITAWLRNRARPFAQVTRRRVVVDHAERTVDVTYWVEIGPPATFGAVTIEGLERTDEAVIRRRLAWTEGEPYTLAKLNQTRDALIGTEVFSSVRLEPARPRGADGTVPIRVTVAERPPRTVALGADFSTALGPGGHVSWTHRNLFGGAEQLTLRGRASLLERHLLARFRRPLLFGGPQDLILTSRFDQRNLDAFDSREFITSAEIERRVSERLTVSAGVALEISRIEADVEEDITLYSLPLALRYDASDDLLNPTEGFRLDGRLVPFAGPEHSFLQMEGRARAYWTPFDQDRVTLAGWLAAGSITGELRDDIPANHRLYSGGGASVRGFGYQRVGPLDSANDPVGGRSLFEVGVEARVRIGENWGAVAFIEGGNVFEATYPDFSRPLRWGAGVGVRYYTTLGPLRLDLAFPLNRRRGDDLFQIYVSIGQAF